MDSLARALPLLLLAAEAFARAGGGQGYSGGSSSSSGGSYSGGGYSGSGYSGYAGSSRSADGALFDALASLVFAYVRFVLTAPVLGVPLTGFLIYIIWSYHLALNERKVVAAIGSGLDRQNELRLRGEREKLKERDPDFDEGRFLARAAGAFLRVQQAWTQGDMSSARPFVSDGVYERFNRQLADLRSRGLVNALQDVRVLGSEVLAYASDPHFDALHVWIKAAAEDRTLDAEGRLLRRDDGEFEEVWAFLRRPSAKTLKAGGNIEGQCPSCGARLSLPDAGQCAACKTWVNSGEHDWVLAEITQRSEWRAPDPQRDVDGWRAFAERDPALSPEAIEDRTSGMFWRYLEALRRRDPGPLLAVATPRACEELIAEAAGGSWRDAAVGAVDLISCERAGPEDRLHVQVKWEAEPVGPGGEGARREPRVRHQSFFVLAREAGARTDGRAGLRTLRCPSCGAPPDRREQAACAYCAKPFNDGARDWVLTAVVPFGLWRRPVSSAGEAPPPMPGADFDAGLAPAEAAAILARGMLADGEVSPYERRFLAEYARARGLSPESVPALIAAAQAGLLDAPAPADGAQAEAMLRGLARMSLADGRVTDAEQAALSAFGKRFGLHHNDVKSLVDEEKAALLKKLRA